MPRELDSRSATPVAMSWLPTTTAPAIAIARIVVRDPGRELVASAAAACRSARRPATAASAPTPTTPRVVPTDRISSCPRVSFDRFVSSCAATAPKMMYAHDHHEARQQRTERRAEEAVLACSTPIRITAMP